MARRKKKSYNPFKMWGSYVGLIIGLAIAYSFEFTRVMSGGNPNPLFSTETNSSKSSFASNLLDIFLDLNI